MAAMVVPSFSLSTAVSSTPRIAVVGSGVAALTCARELALWSGDGAQVTLCTSRSKMATQMGPKNQAVPQNGKPFFDYGVQYVTASDGSAFAADLQRWSDDLGLVRRLAAGAVGTVDAGDGFVPFRKDDACYVGHGGMGVLMTALVDEAERECAGSLEVLRGFPDQRQRVVGLSKTTTGTGWQLRTKDGTTLGPFDAVVGAFGQHCLTDPFLLTGGAAAADMLSCLRRVESNQLIVMQVSFDPPLPATFTAAHVQNEDCLSFIANNARKPHQDGSVGNQEGSTRENWTLISTASFGEREFHTNKKGYRKIAEEQMLAALQRVLNISNLARHAPKINRINHWEDGLSANHPPATRDCLFDASHSLGWCGDFCTTDFPNLEGAATSGRAMARTLALYFREGPESGAESPAYLPCKVDWVPRVVGGSVSKSSSLVDIGRFRHDPESLHPRFTHTDLVPSFVGGYNKQSGRGASGGAPKNSKNNNRQKNNAKNNARQPNRGAGENSNTRFGAFGDDNGGNKNRRQKNKKRPEQKQSES